MLTVMDFTTRASFNTLLTDFLYHADLNGGQWMPETVGKQHLHFGNTEAWFEKKNFKKR